MAFLPTTIISSIPVLHNWTGLCLYDEDTDIAPTKAHDVVSGESFDT